MDSGSSVHVASSADLRHEIERTRIAIGEKIAALNHEVRGTISDASSRVQERLHKARESLDPGIQFHRHPWLFCCCAFVAGYAWRRHVDRMQVVINPYAAREQEMEPRMVETARSISGPAEYAPIRSVRAALLPLMVDAAAGLLRRRGDR